MTPALILTFSPGEKEQRSRSSDFADDQSANPVVVFERAGKLFSLSPGERAGARASVKTNSTENALPAAGCRFEFSAKTIQPLTKLLREELEKL